ncbi:MAG: tyrosine decarboxylase MfnA [Methanosarcinales archaeon]|nr:MAG: tyrosine decarboxylase MfnA [Methanosarcinales archaeon]
MDETGTAESKVLDILHRIKEKDVPFERVLSSMCTMPHPLAVKAHTEFIETNLGDPTIFSGTKELEERVITMLGSLLHAPNAHGYVTAGGTESNIQALRAARNLSGKAHPNVVIPESAHFSFDKAADVLGMELRKASLDEEFRVDPASVEVLTDKNTIALVGIAGTTGLGQIDPIDELAEIALSHDLFLHVDAAFGGLVIPFLDKKYSFDFKVQGVSSMTVDPHKMGASTIPSSALLFRDRACLDALTTTTPYLASRAQHTLAGTRTGASIAATYAVFKYLGRSGYKRIVTRCMKLVSMIEQEAAVMAIPLAIQPVTNVIALRVNSPEEVAFRLKERNWYVSTIFEPKALRLVVMPHLTEEILNTFLDDLKDVLGVVKC